MITIVSRPSSSRSSHSAKHPLAGCMASAQQRQLAALSFTTAETKPRLSSIAPLRSSLKRSAPAFHPKKAPRDSSPPAGSHPLSQLPLCRDSTLDLSCIAEDKQDAQSVAASRSGARSVAAPSARGSVDPQELLAALLSARDSIDDALDLLGAESDGSDGSDDERDVPRSVAAPESPVADVAMVDECD